MLLALDLGTVCGWALFTAAGVLLASGTWRLDTDPYRGRFDAFFLRLLACAQAHGVKTIAHESVHRHAGTDAAHVFGGWLAIVEIVAERTRAEVVGVRTQEIHAAAGHKPDRKRGPKAAAKAEQRRGAAARRRANKEAIVAAAQARGWQVADDNEADACFVGVAVLSKGACP